MDNVILVNEQDEQIGVMDKMKAHRGQGKLHRAISVFLFNQKGEVLLQQRSAKKIVGGKQWANTCCGNVWPGETRLECAQRRLKFELGIDGVELKAVKKFQYFAKCNDEFSENEIDEVFVGEFEGEILSNPDEVITTKWVNWQDLKTEFKTKKYKLDYAPWFVIMMSLDLPIYER